MPSYQTRSAKQATQEERQRVTSIYQRAIKMHSAKNYYSKHWIDYERIWKMFDEERTGEDRWRSVLPDTWTYATIKVAQSAFTDSDVSPQFSRHENDYSQRSKDLQGLYKFIADKGDLHDELYYARLDAFKLGTGFLKTVYIKDTRTVYQIDKFNPDTDEINYREEEIHDFDDPKTVRVSPWFMLWDDMARADISTARDCIEIEVLDWETAKEKYAHLIGGNENWDARVKKANAMAAFLADIQKTSIAQTADSNTRNPVFKEFRFFAPIKIAGNNVELLHYWNKEKDSYEITANGEPLQVKTKKNPSPIPYIHKQLPYTPIHYSPYSGDEFWAAGIIEIGRSDSQSIKTWREMQIDRQKLHLFSPVFSDANDEIDQKQLRLKPLSIIRTQGGVPKQVVIPGAGNADFEIEKRLEESFKRATGIDERTLGLSGQTKKITATEIQFLRESAMRRLREFAYLYKKSLIREVRLKLKLFDQYYSSPLKSKSPAIKKLKVKAKQFNVKVSDNVYTKKEVSPKFFEGELDVDIDMQVLLPMTQAQLASKWGQILKDFLPLIQQGVLNLDIEKIAERYLDSLDVNIVSIKKDQDSEPILMAEGEHKLFVNENTSSGMLEILPNGTEQKYLTSAHIKRHQELLESDDKIGESELMNLIKHITKDTDNLMKMQQQQQAQQLPQQNLSQPITPNI